MIKSRTSTLVYLSTGQRIILSRIKVCDLLRPSTRRRAHAILLVDRTENPHITDTDVSEEVGLTRATVANIRKKYTASGMIAALTPWADEVELIRDLSRTTPA